MDLSSIGWLIDVPSSFLNFKIEQAKQDQKRKGYSISILTILLHEQILLTTVEMVGQDVVDVEILPATNLFKPWVNIFLRKKHSSH